MRRFSGVGLLLALSAVLCTSTGASAGGHREAGAVPRGGVPVIEKAAIPFATRGPAPLVHRFEIRGLVAVPLDYSNPFDERIEIFYRLMPARGTTASDSTVPILVLMNGGPGVPSSSYRSLEYDYEAADEDALSELSKYFRVLAIDQRGTGYSSPLDLDDPRLSPQMLARLFDSDEHALDHARVIAAVVPERERFFILARSYGGEIGFQYLTLEADLRAPAGIIFDSAILPHTDPLETFLLRRRKQRELNLELKTSHPQVLRKLERLRRRLDGMGLNAESVNFLWPYLGKGVDWESDLDRRIDELLSIESPQELRREIGGEIGLSVNLLNYVLSSASLTPGYTDATMTLETSRRVPFEPWMLDENWTLAQVGNDGTWREDFVRSVDRNPPPPISLPPLGEIRRALAEQQVLFTFGKSDAFLPQQRQLARARRFHVPGHTAFEVFDAGHGAAFSAQGAAFVAAWASRLLESTQPQLDFVALMTRVSDGWSSKDTELALGAFTEDAVYMEPPNLHLFRGRSELERFFDAVNPGSSMIWHRLWFDRSSGIGAGEYTFHNGGRSTAAHGVAVVEIRDGKIAVWREYQRRGAIEFQDFLEIEGKDWEWTVNNLE